MESNQSEESIPTVYVVYAAGVRPGNPEPQVQIVGVYESESEAHEVAEMRDKHLAAAQPDVRWNPHEVVTTELFRAAARI